jgi:hypothetical protein
MVQQMLAISIKDLLKSIRQRLDGAIAVARAAEACAEAGDVERGGSDLARCGAAALRGNDAAQRCEPTESVRGALTSRRFGGPPRAMATAASYAQSQPKLRKLLSCRQLG